MFNISTLKYAGLAMVVFAIFGSGYKAGENAQKAIQLEVVQAEKDKLIQARDAFAATLKLQSAKAEKRMADLAQAKQQVKIKWKVKYREIIQYSKSNDVMCYDDKRMQRQETRVNDANHAAQALWGNASTDAYSASR